MPPKSPVATDVARRLWARTAGDASVPEGVPAAADHICVQLRAGLGRWIGVEGYHTLLERALVLARKDHPALGGLSCLGGDEPGMAAAVRTHGAGDVAAGVRALVTVMIELLGRIIGEEMATRLVEQTCMLTPRGVVVTEAGGESDG